MHDEDSQSIAHQVRSALADGGWLTVSEIYARCQDVDSTTTVASVCFTEVAAKRMERSGDRGAYSYRLTERGKAAVANPRFLRSRSNRIRPDRTKVPLPPPVKAQEHDTSLPLAAVAELHKKSARGRACMRITARRGELTDEAAATANALVRQSVGQTDIDDSKGQSDHPQRRMAAAVLLYWPRSAPIPEPLQRILFESIALAAP